MAQGKLKLAKKKPHRVTKRQRNPKAKARKIFKPKKISFREKELHKLDKKERGRLWEATEKAISAKIGHLELLKGTRREIEANEKKAKQKKFGETPDTDDVQDAKKLKKARVDAEK
ncbi:hypothetical protein BRETT_001814 [Brettanomyces bruxellensis]|uniref:Uncharacterized protein n=1 Tax=Dekkera bruxellensis TaxID=5007 RepID=A0A871R152_DEKBR|nr:uncharacterized protein BRETT_001814 [Brettanomyces bruxellensis]QOU18746.1 hypothetical protein BRETT_001814 [Brettanomyces bruxellensis]